MSANDVSLELYSSSYTPLDLIDMYGETRRKTLSRARHSCGCLFCTTLGYDSSVQKGKSKNLVKGQNREHTELCVLHNDDLVSSKTVHRAKISIDIVSAAIVAGEIESSTGMISAQYSRSRVSALMIS